MQLNLLIPVIDTIKKRHSVRTFENKKLSEEERERLKKIFKELSNPFGVDVNIYMIDKDLDPNGEKLGTYGMIKGASTFLGVSVPNVDDAFIATGYQFETLILYATSMGLGTTWMAATFNRDRFASAMKIKQNEWFIAVSPVGYPATKQSIRESIIRKSMNSSRRKPWNEIFYQDDFFTPLEERNAGIYSVCLEMFRLAPSAKNEQPWRVLKQGNIYHFYETHNKNLSSVEAKIKQVDLGIALSHFHHTALEQGLTGRFEKLSVENINLPDNMWYMISWIAE